MKPIKGLIPGGRVPAHGVITIGKFDTLHLGHKKLIGVLVKEATSLNLPSIAMTLAPPSGNEEKERLVTDEQRAAILNCWGIKFLIVVRMEPAFMKLSPEDFFYKILRDRLNVREIVVGPDFRFGTGRKGDISLLRKMTSETGVILRVVSLKRDGKRKIASSVIRNMVGRGELEAAKKLLGRYWSLSGRISKGSSLGKKMGIPTANIKIGKNIMAPPGVYMVLAELGGGKRCWGVANIGRSPTLKGLKRSLLEVHLLDYKGGDLYNKDMHVQFVRKIRAEKTFYSQASLKKRIIRDICTVRSYMRKSDSYLC